jgi:hypothetical protein
VAVQRDDGGRRWHDGVSSSVGFDDGRRQSGRGPTALGE